MNAIAIGLFVLTAGLLLAGLFLLRRRSRRRRQRPQDGRRQPGIEPAESGRVKGAHWPDGYRGTPRSEDPGDGDGAT